MNKPETPLAEMTTEQLETKFDVVQTEIEKIAHIGKGEGMTPRFWNLAERSNTLFQLLDSRKRYTDRNK